MFSWHANIFIRLLLPFLLGIGMNLSGLFPDFIIPVWLLFVFAFLFFLQISLWKKYVRYSTSWQYAIFPNLFFLALGFFLTHNQKLSMAENHCLDHYLNKQMTYTGEVISPLKETERTYKFFCKVTLQNESIRNQESKVLVLLKKDSLGSPTIKVGDIFSLKGKLQSIKSNQNPGGFDYAKYLKDRGVYYQVFSERNKFLWLGTKSSFDIVFYGLLVRDKVLRVFEKYILDKKALAITSAILLGYDELLETKVKAVFAAAGAMHILCVSGLHVGIIYLMFSSLLKYFDKNKKTRIIKSLILISIIVSYALITGLSPSVLRASVMFVVIIIGKVLQRKISIYNLLAFSAFLLLVFNPLLIREIGFQLSYLAVTGIVTIYPKIYPLFLSKYSLINKAWSLSIVSFAAILSTFPLSIYYFHQFPAYFFVTNLIVIPAAVFIIYAGITLITVSYFEILASFVGKILIHFLRFLFFILHELTALPGAVIRDLFLSPWMVIVLFLITFTSIAFFLYNRHKALLYVLLSFLALEILVGLDDYSKIKQKELIIYADKHSSMMDVIIGKEAVFIGDSLSFYNQNKQQYLFQPFELMYGINSHRLYSSSTPSQGVYHRYPYTILGKKTVFQLCSTQKYRRDLSFPLPVDILWIHNMYAISSLSSIDKMNPEVIVVGAKVSGKVKDYLLAYAEMKKIVLYSIQKQGALHYNY